MWGASQWADALASRYFSPVFELEPVTLCVDREELASLRGTTAEAAVEELAFVVRRELMPGFRFDAIWRRCEHWRNEGCPGVPPSLPLLALNVLAASQMSAAESGAPNFYKALRRLLDPKDDAGGMPGAYDAWIPRMWEQVAWWLDDELGGARGMSTITRHEHFTNIGYALQQSVLRAADRQRIHRFLRSIGFVPGDDVVAEELRLALAIWARRLGQAGTRLVRLVTDQGIQPYADEFLRQIAERWDGGIKDPRTGALALPMRVFIEDQPFAIGLVLERSTRAPTTIKLRNGEDTVQLESNGAFYLPTPLPLSLANVLSDGIELTGSGASAVFDPALVHPLVYNYDLAGWVSTGGIAFGEVYTLLVRKEIWSSLAAWIKQERITGNIDAGATPSLPEGWFVVRRFRLDARPRSRPPSAIADLLGSGGGARTRLVGGVKVGGVRHTYLLAGLPFLAVPTDDEVVHVKIETDDYEPVQLTAKGGELSLNVINLGPGTYRVTHPQGRTEFDVVAGISQRPGGGVGSVATSGADGRSATGLVAAVPSPRPPVVVPVPSNVAPFAVLGPSPGDVAIVETPYWLTKPFGELSWDATDVWCDFIPVWLVDLGANRARLLARREVAPGAVGSSWERLILRAEVASTEPSVVELWNRYRAHAHEVLR